MATIRIKDTLRNWPWKRIINPHFEECKIESTAWLENFNIFPQKAQKAFNNCDFSLLASLAYPKLNKDGCRVGCDLMMVFFVFDDFSDVCTPEETRMMADVKMDALRNPYKPRPRGEWIGGELTRQFWVNVIRTATPIAQRRFIETYEEYVYAVVEQSADRGQNHVRTLEDYFKLRRRTVAAKASFIIIQLHMNIPDYVMENETIQSLTLGCIDMLWMDNDLYSYNAEQAYGDSLHNCITIVMSQFRLDIQSAFERVGNLREELSKKFLQDYNNIPSWGSGIDDEVKQYVDGLANWVRANEQWSFGGQRYFGTDGLRVLEERTFTLLPKREFSSVKPNEKGARIGGDRLHN